MQSTLRMNYRECPIDLLTFPHQLININDVYCLLLLMQVSSSGTCHSVWDWPLGMNCWRIANSTCSFNSWRSSIFVMMEQLPSLFITRMLVASRQPWRRVVGMMSTHSMCINQTRISVAPIASSLPSRWSLLDMDPVDLLARPSTLHAITLCFDTTTCTPIAFEARRPCLDPKSWSTPPKSTPTWLATWLLCFVPLGSVLWLSALGLALMSSVSPARVCTWSPWSRMLLSSKVAGLAWQRRWLGLLPLMPRWPWKVPNLRGSIRQRQPSSFGTPKVGMLSFPHPLLPNPLLPRHRHSHAPDPVRVAPPRHPPHHLLPMCVASCVASPLEEAGWLLVITKLAQPPICTLSAWSLVETLNATDPFAPRNAWSHVIVSSIS